MTERLHAGGAILPVSTRISKIRALLYQAVFENTMNLLALSVMLAAWLLTDDTLLLTIAIVGEMLYLSAVFWWKRIPERLRWEAGLGVDALDRVLLVVAVVGVLVVMFFGFGKHLMTHRLPELTHAAGWEGGAIAWTCLFVFYYLCKLGRLDKRWNVLLGLGLLIAFGFCLWQAWRTMGDPLPHVLWLGGVVVVLLCSDWIMAYRHTDPKERRLSRASLWWADLPTAAVFGILALYLLLHPDAERREVFVAGVVTCQLFFSNTVFIVMEFEVLGAKATGAQELKQEARG